MTSSAAAPVSRRELEEKIIARAWRDEAFRQKFLADPKGQFEAELGTKLPESLTITAHEEGPDSVHFVIPLKPAASLEELSDEDLEKVAGGVDVIVSITILATLAGTSTIIFSEQMAKWAKSGG